MTRLVRAEWFKLRTTRLYVGLLAVAAALVLLITAIQFALGDDSSLTIEDASAVVESQADLRSILNVAGIAALFTLVLGATAMSGEHRHGTVASTFLVTPARHRVVLAKVIAYAIGGAVFGIVVEAVALAVAVGWLAATGTAVPFGASVAAGLALTPVGTGLAAGFGVGVGAAIPNQLGAVLITLGWVMVAEQLLGGLVPSVADWLPFRGANTAITGDNTQLDAAGGVALFTVYLAAVSAAGIAVAGRRDVA